MNARAYNILLISLLVHSIFTLILVFRGSDSFLSDDSPVYIGIGQNLIEHGVYSMDRSTTAPIADNVFTPLYPIFLIPFVLFHIKLFFAATLQGIFVSLSAVFLYLLGRKLFSERVAHWAALLFALEPGGLYLSNLIMPEALFILFFLPALFYCALYIKEGKKMHIIYGAALLAIASLVRPVAFYFIFFIPLAVLLSNWRKIAWRESCIALAIFCSILSPWFLYNFATFSSLQISSTPDANLYFFNAYEFEKWFRPSSEPFFTPENYKRIVSKDGHELTPVTRVKEGGRIARSFILGHLPQYIVFHTLYVPRLFFHNEYANIYNRVLGVKHNLSSTNFYEDIIKLRVQNVINEITSRPILLIVFIPKIFFAAITIMAFLHPFLMRSIQGVASWKVSVFFMALLIFYAFLASPIGDYRLRFPLQPVFFILALDALRVLCIKYINRLQIGRSQLVR